MTAVVVYAAGRIAAFLVPLVIVWAVGVDGFLALMIALVLSIPLSYFGLRRQREEATAALYQRAQRKASEREQSRRRGRPRGSDPGGEGAAEDHWSAGGEADGD